jgi:hypothetical protein
MLVAGGVAWSPDYEDLAKEFRAMDIWGGPWCPVNNWNVVVELGVELQVLRQRKTHGASVPIDTGHG